MRWGLRTVVTLAVAASVLNTGIAGAATPRKGSGLSYGHPCTYLTAKQVQKVYRAPVAVDPSNRGLNTFIANACAFIVGSTGNPVGVLVSRDVYPYFPPPGQTAIDALQAQRATDSLAFTVVDGGIGRQSYLNIDQSLIVVAPNKKFAFSLQWLPPGTGSDGQVLDAKTRKRLTALAMLVVAHAPR